MHRVHTLSPGQRHWALTRRLTATLFAAWLATTFCVIFFARALARLTLFGWPCSYYMAAQGTTLMYLAIVGLYGWRKACLDKQHRRDTAAADTSYAAGRRRNLAARAVLSHNALHCITVSTRSASMARPTLSGGPKASAWWRCSSPPSCVSWDNLRFRISWLRATATLAPIHPHAWR